MKLSKIQIEELCHLIPDWMCDNFPDVMVEHRSDWLIKNRASWILKYRIDHYDERPIRYNLPPIQMEVII